MCFSVAFVDGIAVGFLDVVITVSVDGVAVVVVSIVLVVLVFFLCC